MNEQKRVPLNLLPQHLDYIVNLLGTANLPYVQTAPIIADIQQQIAAQNAPQMALPINGDGAVANTPVQ